MRKFWRSFFKTLIFVCVLPCFILLGLAVGIIASVLHDTEPIDSNQLTMNFTSFIYYYDYSNVQFAEDGTILSGQPEKVVLQALYGTENRVWADWDTIPQYMKDAFVAIEDERFYSHKGFDPKRIGGAAINYIKSNLLHAGTDIYGGSTITQQLVKNVTGDDDVRLERKLKEIYRAYRLEKDLDKEKILELYLNTIYLSQQCNGVASAADVYFGKDISELSLAECAAIAGITQFPTKYDPYVNPAANKEKQEIVLYKMYELGFISQSDYEEALQEDLIFRHGNTTTGSNYSYFVDTVIEEVLNDLENKCGYSPAMAQKLLYTGGLQIEATIDPTVQAAIDDVYQNDAYFPDTYSDTCMESAMIVLEPTTGAIKGVVGGRGVKIGGRTLNRATQALRQPGSTIKPIGVYAPALDQEVITPSSWLKDTPVTYTNKSGETWTPHNSGGSYYGYISPETAIAYSRNVPAVRVLYQLTPRKSFDFLTQKLHITTLVENETRNGNSYSDISLAPLSLGGLTDGISVMELTGAYTPFDNRGIYKQPHSYNVIYDYKDRLFLQKDPISEVAISEYTTYYMQKYMKAVVSYGTGSSARFSSDIATAGKTGTTTNDHDRWFVGFTPYYVAAVWVGYDIPKAMRGFSGNPAIPPWKAVMTKIHTDLPAADFNRPDDLVSVAICSDCSGLAAQDCWDTGRIITRDYRAGTQPTWYCDPATCHVSYDAPEEGGADGEASEVIEVD